MEARLCCNIHYTLSGESTCCTAGFLLCLRSKKKKKIFSKAGNWLLKVRKDNCRNKTSYISISIYLKMSEKTMM